MKFCVDKNLFEESLSMVERAISTRSTLPVLNNVLLDAKNNKLTLITTNLEIAIKTTIPIKLEKEGRTTIPVKLLSSYISLINSQEIEVELKDAETIHIQTKESNTKIKGISADEFPLIPKIEEEKSIKIPVKYFMENVASIVFASALDELRPVLAGVYLKALEGKMYAVATDSYRLVEVTKEIKDKDSFSVIIPSRAVLELSRIIQKYNDKDIQIDMAKNQAKFTCENIELISRLIEGQYPDYRKIIPNTTETLSTVKKNDLVTAVKRASLFARENSNSIKLNVMDDRINIIVDTVQSGSENASVSAKTVGGEKTIAFNAQYLIDALNNLDSENVIVGVNSSITPGVIKGENRGDVLHVIMPLKV